MHRLASDTYPNSLFHVCFPGLEPWNPIWVHSCLASVTIRFPTSCPKTGVPQAETQRETKLGVHPYRSAMGVPISCA